MRFLKMLAGLALGYVAGALLGSWLIQLLSANTHDRSLEAAMTGAFVTGPIGAVLGLVIGLSLRWRESPGKSPSD